MGLGMRGRDHNRPEKFNGDCSKCGERTMVPWDPKKEPARVVMCRNCRAFYS